MFFSRYMMIHAFHSRRTDFHHMSYETQLLLFCECSREPSATSQHVPSAFAGRRRGSSLLPCAREDGEDARAGREERPRQRPSGAACACTRKQHCWRNSKSRANCPLAARRGSVGVGFLTARQRGRGVFGLCENPKNFRQNSAKFGKMYQQLRFFFLKLEISNIFAKF